MGINQVGTRVYGTAEVDAKEFKELLSKLKRMEGYKQYGIMTKAGKAAHQVIRDETISGWTSNLNRLKQRTGEFGYGVTRKGSYSSRIRPTNGYTNWSVIGWINYKEDTNRLAHLFDAGFVPGRGGLKGKKRRSPRGRYQGWNVRKNAVARSRAKVEKVFFRAIRILIRLDGRDTPTIGQLQRGGSE